MTKVRRQRTAVFISGRGSNLQALITKAHHTDYPASIDLVLSDNPTAQGIPIGQGAGVPTYVVDKKKFRGNRDVFERALEDLLEAHRIDLVCLAGFMHILSSSFVSRWQGRVLNIHPSLLPNFPGLNTHERALKAGVPLHGCTVHFVTCYVDSGPIILQRSIPVFYNDTPQTLGERVLKEEHKAYPEALARICTTLF